MSAQKRRGGRLAVLAGAALVVPLAVGATVVAAEPDGPGGPSSTVAAGRSPSPVPGAGPADAPGRGADQSAGQVVEDSDEKAAAPKAADPAGGRTPETSRGPGTAQEPAGSLAEVAAREPSAPRADGLARAAGQRPENGEGARGSSGEALDRTKGLTQRADVAPDQVHDADSTPGGCLAEYGEAGQCLPTVPPSLAKHVQDMEKAGQDVSSMPHHWDCAEVRTFFPDGITVRQAGADPQGLDTDKDGTACGAGD